MTTQAEESQIISKHNKFLRDKGRESAKIKLRVTSEYLRLCKAKTAVLGSDVEIGIREELKERFELNDRRLQNILDNKDRFLNANEQAFTSQMVMAHYAKGIQVATEALDGLNEYVDHIEDMEAQGEEWIDTEKFASSKGVNIKSLTPREAKNRILRERLEVVLKSFDPLKTLAPKVIQLEDNTPRFDTLDDIRIQRDELKKQLKLEDEISD